MKNIPDIDVSKLKDKKVKFFIIKESGSATAGTSRVRSYIKETDGSIATFWAYYQSISGYEQANANAEKPRRVAQFIVNYNADITTDHYIEDERGRIYNITFIDDKRGNAGCDLPLNVVETHDADGVPMETAA